MRLSTSEQGTNEPERSEVQVGDWGSEGWGTHGSRGTFARQRYREYRDQGPSIAQVAHKLTRDMGHGRVEVLRSYIELD